jgi:hypothetical protein
VLRLGSESHGYGFGSGGLSGELIGLFGRSIPSRRGGEFDRFPWFRLGGGFVVGDVEQWIDFGDQQPDDAVFESLGGGQLRSAAGAVLRVDVESHGYGFGSGGLSGELIGLFGRSIPRRRGGEFDGFPWFGLGGGFVVGDVE